MRRVLTVLHRWFGLSLAVFLFVSGATGAIIAFDHELDGLLNPGFYAAATDGEPLPALEIARRLEEADPRLRITYLPLAVEPGHALHVFVAPRGDAELPFNQLSVDPATGVVQDTRMWGAVSLSRKNALSFLYELHYSLHLPRRFGLVFMGIVAIAWTLDCFVAIAISFPNPKLWRRSFRFSWRDGGRKLLFDVHRSGGVWLWPLLLVLAMTAVSMNLGDEVVRPVVALFSDLTPDPFTTRTPAETPIEPLLSREQIVEKAVAEGAARGWTEAPGGLFYAAEHGLYGVGFFEAGNDHGDGGLGNAWLYFDALDGSPAGAEIPGEGTAGDLFLQAQFPLHSGRLLGLPGRVLVAFLGVAVATLSVTGVVLWARKRRVAVLALLAAASPAAAEETDDDETIEVVAPTEGESLERSAQAVTVVETEDEQRQSADLGEVMARSRGVGVRRSGGLGSETRFSLNGLTDDQVRFFLDGVPLDLAGYPLGISNVPVDAVERAEVFRGVVPVRFGADALGGAVNLVSEREDGAGVSWQAGSFHTHRVAAHGRATFGPVHTGATAFFDASANDYAVDVEVPDETGQLVPTSVRRFHDGYGAGGGTVEVGVEDFVLRGFASAFQREIQHNVVMTVPYGSPEYGVSTAGGTAAWHHTAGDLAIDVVAGPTWTERTFTDLGTCVVDWYGHCVRERALPGEITSPGSDQVVRDRSIVARASFAYRGFTLALAPSAFDRTGEDHLFEGEGHDPLASRRRVGQLVAGIEHQLDVGDDFQNLLFAKAYGQSLDSEEPVPAGDFREVGRTTARFGAGDSVRLRLAHRLWAKASYELATRLPTPQEVFGDAVLVLDNLELAPETSHNANLGLTTRVERDRIGVIDIEANAFLRDARDLIVLLGNDRAWRYENVLGARSVGVEGGAAWTSPGEWLAIDANGTWLDLRNTSSDGTFGAYAGDRVPNRPWLFANGAVTVGVSGVARPEDRLTVDLYTRYVHGFYRGWESVGFAAFKQTIPAQLSHTAALTYAAPVRQGRFSASVEVQNLTDAYLYDFFGVQRPGRAVFGKLAVAR